MLDRDVHGIGSYLAVPLAYIIVICIVKKEKEKKKFKEKIEKTKVVVVCRQLRKSDHIFRKMVMPKKVLDLMYEWMTRGLGLILLKEDINASTVPVLWEYRKYVPIVTKVVFKSL